MARAHLGHDVLRAERYLKLEVDAHEVRCVVSLTLGPGPMEHLLRQADSNADRQVTPAEADLYMTRWAEALTDELTLSIDGEAVSLRWEEPFFEPVGAVRPQTGSVEWVGRHPIDAGVHRLVLVDAMAVGASPPSADPPEGSTTSPISGGLERTDVRLTARAGVELLATGFGNEDPVGQREDFVQLGANALGPLSLQVRVPGWSRAQRAAALGGGALLAFTSSLAWWRLRRRR